MTLTITLLALAASVAVFALSWVMERRPYVPGRLLPRPWIFLQIVTMVVILLLLAHLVSLATGQRLVGRFER